jgi:hypothetical protein
MSNLNIPESAVAAYEADQKQWDVEACAPTDEEFFEWCFKHIGGEDALTKVFENADANEFVCIGCALLMLCLPRSKEGMMSESNCRDLIVSDHLRAAIMPIFRKYYYEDCCEWFEKQEGE